MEYRNHNMLLGHLCTLNNTWLVYYSCDDQDCYDKSVKLYGKDAEKVEELMINFITSRDVVVDKVMTWFPYRKYGIHINKSFNPGKLDHNVFANNNTTPQSLRFLQLNPMKTPVCWCCMKADVREQCSIDVKVYSYSQRLDLDNDKYVVDKKNDPLKFVIKSDERYKCYVYIDDVRFDTELVPPVTEIYTISNEFGVKCTEKPIVFKPHNETYIHIPNKVYNDGKDHIQRLRYKVYNCEYFNDTCLQQAMKLVINDMHVRICILPFDVKVADDVIVAHTEMSKYKILHFTNDDFPKSHPKTKPSKCIFDAFFTEKAKPPSKRIAKDKFERLCNVKVFAVDKEIFPDKDGNYEANIDDRIKFIITREMNEFERLYTYIDNDRLDNKLCYPSTELYVIDNLYGIKCDEQLIKFRPSSKSFNRWDLSLDQKIDVKAGAMHIKMCMCNAYRTVVNCFFDAYINIAKCELKECIINDEGEHVINQKEYDSRCTGTC
jgi:hypothetical protein